MKRLIELTIAFGMITLETVAQAAPLPRQIGKCSNTFIQEVTTRLEGAPGSGSNIFFTNGGRQVSYDTIPAIEQSKPGHTVKVCLQSIPSNCPPGDNRGRIYRTLNYNTGKGWTLPDSQHFCGGA